MLWSILTQKHTHKLPFRSESTRSLYNLTAPLLTPNNCTLFRATLTSKSQGAAAVQNRLQGFSINERTAINWEEWLPIPGAINSVTISGDGEVRSCIRPGRSKAFSIPRPLRKFIKDAQRINRIYSGRIKGERILLFCLPFSWQDSTQSRTVDSSLTYFWNGKAKREREVYSN